MKKKSIVMAAVLAGLILAVSGTATATPSTYPNPGTPNPVLYTFTAANTGDILAYFAGSTASFTNDISMLVNGVATGVYGLENQTSLYGDVFNMGSVNAGDTIVFVMRTTNPPTGIGPWYSEMTLNSDGINHVYSNSYAGDSLIPAGVYVAFEDLPDGGDFNYNDESFVFTNIIATSVPEPSSLLLLGFGISSALVALRKRA
jgi:hypothetical protein